MNLSEEEKRLILEWSDIYRYIKKDISYLRTKEDKEKARALKSHIKRLKPELKKIISKYEKGFFNRKAQEKRINELMFLLDKITINPNKNIIVKTIDDFKYILALIHNESRINIDKEKLRKIVLWFVGAVTGFLLMKTSLVFKEGVDLKRIENEKVQIEISMLHHLAKKHSLEIIDSRRYKQFDYDLNCLKKEFEMVSGEIDNFKILFNNLLDAKEEKRRKELKRKMKRSVHKIEMGFTGIFTALKSMGLKDDMIITKTKVYVENIYNLILGFIGMLISLYGIMQSWKTATKREINRRFEEMKEQYKVITNSQQEIIEQAAMREVITQDKIDELQKLFIEGRLEQRVVVKKIDEIKKLLKIISDKEKDVLNDKSNKLKKLFNKIKI